MAALALAQICGLVLAFALPGWPPRLAALAALGAGLVALAAKQPARMALVPVFFAFGCLSLLPWTEPAFPPNHVTHFTGAGKLPVSGIVDGRPERFGSRTRFVLDVRSIDGKPAMGKIRVTARTPIPDLPPGSEAAFESPISPLTNFANPGGFDYVRFMAFKGIFGSAYLRGRDNLTLRSAPESFLDRTRLALKDLVSGASRPRARPLLYALLLGEKEHVSQDTRDLFASAGIAHILAISGLHMGMVAVFAFGCFRLLLSRSPKILLSGRLFALCAVLTIPPVVYYGLVAGMSPSTQRAVVMVSVFLLAYVFERDYDSFNTLALAAVIILAVHPPALFDVSFQLSFTAVFAILYGMKRLNFRTVPITWREKALRRLLIYALIPVFASLGSLPLALYYFDRFSLIGPLANLLAVPLAGFVVLPLCLLASLTLPFFPWTAHIMMEGAALALDALVSLAGVFARVPWASVMPLKPSLAEIALFYGILFSLIHIREKAFRWVLALCLLASAVDAAYWINRRFLDPDLRVTILDVGQGNSAVVQFPHGPVMVVDGGGLAASSTFDTGRMIVAPFLWQNKIHTVDFVALTHPQQDHAGGLGYITERFHVGQFWSNGQQAPIHAWQHIVDACRNNGIEAPDLGVLRVPREINGVKIQVLHPEAGFLDSPEADAMLNDNSLVLRLEMDGISFLFTGDIEEPGETALLARWGPKSLHSTVCLAPHHGSKTSSSPEFVQAVKPDCVVFSASARNWYGFPDKDVVRRYVKAGALPLDTGKHGAIMFRTDGKKLEYEVFIEPIAKPVSVKKMPGKGSLLLSFRTQ